jgi:hypothetical protein
MGKQGKQQAILNGLVLMNGGLLISLSLLCQSDTRLHGGIPSSMGLLRAGLKRVVGLAENQTTLGFHIFIYIRFSGCLATT